MGRQIHERNNFMPQYVHEIQIDKQFRLDFKNLGDEFFAADIIFIPNPGAGYSQSLSGSLIGFLNKTKYPEGPAKHWELSIYFGSESQEINDEKLGADIVDSLKNQAIITEPLILNCSEIYSNSFERKPGEKSIGYFKTYGDLGLD